MDTKQNTNEGVEKNANLICKLECNVDDCTGEALGYTMDRLLEAGALDVHYIPVFMKKNRPAYLLTVLCRPGDREQMEEILFRETSTIGIRYQYMQRTVLPRNNETISTSLGGVDVKIIETPEGKRFVPEYESIAAIARERGISFQQVYKQVEADLLRGTIII
jgi:hypothetical protein